MNRESINQGAAPGTAAIDKRLSRLEEQVGQAAARQTDPKEPADFAGDKVGSGRYILGFVIAGPLGLLANYWARYYGWRGTWITLAIFVAGIIFLVAAGSFDNIGQTCYQYPDGSIRCN